MIDERGRRTELVCPALPSPFNLLAGVLAWDALSASDRWAILRIGDALRGRQPIDPAETVRQWLVRHHQSARLCTLFWEPLALAALNQSIDVAAAGMFVAVTSRMFGSGGDAASLLVPSVPLDALYVEPAMQFLADAASTVTTHAKARIVVEDGRVVGIRVGGDDIPASVVISAVPWFAIGEVFESPPPELHLLLANAAALGSAPIVTVNLWFESLPSSDPMLGLPGRTFQWIFDRRRYVGETQTHVSLISSGADAICARPNDELVDTAVREFDEAVPEARGRTPRHASVIRERRATFSLAPGSPPRPATATPIRGLYLAGDWIDTGLPATIESAVISGHRAASAVLAALE
jgi:squalene-associated FAD-dependent desaturase